MTGLNRYVLIRTVGSGCGGSDLRLGQTGARSGGVVDGVRSPRRRLAGVGRSRPSGLHFERGLAREDARSTRNSPGRLARVCGGCNVSRHGMGGSVQRSSPAYNAPGVAVALTLRGLAQQVERADALLTEGLWWPVLRCSGEVDNGRAAEADRDSWGRSTQRDYGVLGSLDRLGRFLWRCRVG
jgi:hypothetical protein